MAIFQMLRKYWIYLMKNITHAPTHVLSGRSQSVIESTINGPNYFFVFFFCFPIGCSFTAIEN